LQGFTLLYVVEGNVLGNENLSFGHRPDFVYHAIGTISDALEALVATAVLIFHQLLLGRGRLGWLV
jgi:hypothetical protein